MYVEELIKIGLSKPEAGIYSSLLKFGDLSASEIADKTDIGRTNVYEYAGGLVKGGMVSRYERAGKIFFRAENPLQLRELVEQRIREARELDHTFSALLPKLETLFNENINRPAIKFFQGEAGFKTVMDMVYMESRGNLIFYLLPDLDDYTPPLPKYRSSLLSRQVFTNLIANQGQALSEFNKRDQRELRSTVIVSEDDIRISEAMILFDDTVVTGNLFADSFAVTMIRSKSMSALLKSMLKTILKNR